MQINAIMLKINRLRQPCRGGYGCTLPAKLGAAATRLPEMLSSQEIIIVHEYG